MRVLDSKPIDSVTIQSMGKRKQRLKQKEAANQSSDDETNEASFAVKCKHISRSVNIGSLKKGLKNCSSIDTCTNCSDETVVKDPLVGDIEGSNVGIEFLEVPSVYMCLHCGHQGCDRNSEKKHALAHYETVRSSPHEMAVNMTSWQVWCYACDDFIELAASRKLEECVEFVQRLSKANKADSAGNSLNETRFTETKTKSALKTDVLESKDTALKVKPISSVTSDVLSKCAKVKGLVNLGNTCFFNAVMQNLSQTHYLESQLRDYAVKGMSVTLVVACPLDSKDKLKTESHSEDEEDYNNEIHQGHTLSVTLGEAGGMTRSLLTFLEEMHSKEVNKQNSVRPSELFGHICQKAPRFKGFQQQDSHELLHYLLDGIKAEETKRARNSILKAFNLSENVKAKDVPAKYRQKIKAFGSHTRHTFIDSVFGGYFINTVVCETCSMHHQIFESFLDISLPVSEDKQSSQQAVRSKKVDEKANVSVDQDKQGDGECSSPSGKQSKNMTKKQLKAKKKKVPTATLR